jgi:hypothetical protein
MSFEVEHTMWKAPNVLTSAEILKKKLLNLWWFSLSSSSSSASETPVRWLNVAASCVGINRLVMFVQPRLNYYIFFLQEVNEHPTK